MEHKDCKFIGDDGGCDLLFHEPDELNRMCTICKEYEPKGDHAYGRKRDKTTI